MQSRRLEKVTLNLFEGDMEKVRQLAGSAGASVVIRSLVAAFIERNEAKMTPAPDLSTLVEVPNE